MIKYAALVGLLLTCSCSGIATQAKTDLIGMPRSDLISCAGVPDKSVLLPDREVLQFEQNQQVQGPLDIKGPMSLELSLGGKGTCHAVVTLRAGVVSGVGYTGPSGTLLGPYAACVPILRGCLRYTHQGFH